MVLPITAHLQDVIAKRVIPGITVWNRLEGRPRADNFERALRAEVRDALWMLTRQWQMGEFRGDDAASAIFAKVHVATTTLSKYQSAHGPVEPFTDAVPLEAQVEELPVPLVQDGRDVALDIRLLVGRHWLKLIATVAPGPAVASQFVAAYPIHRLDPTDAADAPTCAHPEASSMFDSVAGRRMDGVKLYAHLVASPANHASDGIAALAGMDAVVDPIAARFVAWFDRLIFQPPGPAAWIPERLEYQFAASAPLAGGTEKVLVADEYFHGHLDWHNFDVDSSRHTLGDPGPAAVPPAARTLTLLPTQVTFNGMPNTRWWAFEDSRTNFGDVKPDTTDLAKLLLIEFGLDYANDWLVVPFTVPAGSIANVRGLAVTNVFGERTWVEPAGAGDDEDWQRWAMFLLSIKGDRHQPADLSLVLPPAARSVLEGRPLEDVALARDEMANMVWGVERTVPLPTGQPKNGHDAAAQTRAFHERNVGPATPVPFAAGAKVRYHVMSQVPENWIPMIPVHVEGDNREIQLQRAAMLRIVEGVPNPPPIRPRTSLLRHGLDQAPPAGYRIHEEEVPRAGTRVTLGYQRTRWSDGRAFVWLGIRKKTGRGEGSSGLAFDRLTNVPPTP